MSRLKYGALRERQDRRFDREIGLLRAAEPIVAGRYIPIGAAFRATSGARLAARRPPIAKPV